MTTPITQWHTEHLRFARLLDLLEAQVAVFHEGGQPNLPLMLDIVTYLRDYADQTHHPREDAAFKRLQVHDPAQTLPINRLLQEHRVIAVAGAELMEHLEDVIADAMVLRAAVEAAAAQYLAYYRHHIGTEERHIMPRAARLLTPEDWAHVAASAPLTPDPLFDDPPSDVYRDLRQLLSARETAG